MSSVLIIGSNRGIGLELVRHYVKRGDTVFAACRKASPELLKENVKIIENIDISHDSVIEKLKDSQILPKKLDIVIANAGILFNDTYKTIQSDHLMQQYNTNAIGPLRVAQGTFDRLETGSKFGIISSVLASIEENNVKSGTGGGGKYGYRMSKCAVNIAGKSLSIDWRRSGISVGLLHPGYVKTEMTGGLGHLEADVSAQSLLANIDNMEMSNSGSFWNIDGKFIQW